MSKAMPPVQKTYAQVLSWIAVVGQILLLIGYVLYLSRLLPQRQPIERLAGSWHLSAARFSEELGVETGWSWIRDLGHGDVVSYATVIFLALGTKICLLAAALGYIREKNSKYALIVILQIVVLLVAASGIVKV